MIESLPWPAFFAEGGKSRVGLRSQTTPIEPATSAIDDPSSANTQRKAGEACARRKLTVQVILRPRTSNARVQQPSQVTMRYNLIKRYIGLCPLKRIVLLRGILQKPVILHVIRYIVRGCSSAIRGGFMRDLVVDLPRIHSAIVLQAL